MKHYKISLTNAGWLNYVVLIVITNLQKSIYKIYIVLTACNICTWIHSYQKNETGMIMFAN